MAGRRPPAGLRDGLHVVERVFERNHRFSNRRDRGSFPKLNR
jgi:hypothetical protein